MRPSAWQSRPIIVIALCVVTVLGHAVGAAGMSSSNYSVPSDSVNFGGTYSASGTYQVWDSIGETADGGELSGTTFKACAGFQCLVGESFITFTVTQGTSAPGTAGTGVGFGTLTPGSVATSNGSSINSIFMTLEAVAIGGVEVTVVSENSALARTSAPLSTIDSATANLSVATEGYGLCVESVSEDAGSPSSLDEASPYDSACDKTTNHNVGIVDGTTRPIITTSGHVVGGSAEVLVKTKASGSTPGGSDYADTLTFIAMGTF
jgi:hypothetical protein